jgi:hypothetical protein
LFFLSPGVDSTFDLQRLVVSENDQKVCNDQREEESHQESLLWSKQSTCANNPGGLAEIFRPPTDITYHGDYNDAPAVDSSFNLQRLTVPENNPKVCNDPCEEETHQKSFLWSNHSTRTNTPIGGLADIFRPPTNITYRGDYNAALYEAVQTNKCLLVSIQDYENFKSHEVNRDIFRNHLIQQLITEHFIFWQSTYSSEDGKQFCRLFHLGRRDAPFLGVVDPKFERLIWNQKQRWKHHRPWAAFEICQSLSEICFDHRGLDSEVPAAGPRESASVKEETTPVGDEEGIPSCESNGINYADEFAIQEALGIKDGKYCQIHVFDMDLQRALWQSKEEY